MYSRPLAEMGEKKLIRSNCCNHSVFATGFSLALHNISGRRGCYVGSHHRMKVSCDQGQYGIISLWHPTNWRLATAAHFRMQGNTIPQFRSIKQSLSMSCMNLT